MDRGEPAHAVFRSTHHPGGAPSALIYGHALVRPLGACMIPVMIGITTAVLEQLSILPYLTWGVPAAMLTAIGWTRFRLGTTVAEVHVRTGQAAVRSVHDCLWSHAPLIWDPIHDLRKGSDALYLTVGWETYALPYAEWPDHQALLDELQSARHATPKSA